MRVGVHQYSTKASPPQPSARAGLSPIAKCLPPAGTPSHPPPSRGRCRIQCGAVFASHTPARHPPPCGEGWGGGRPPRSYRPICDILPQGGGGESTKLTEQSEAPSPLAREEPALGLVSGVPEGRMRGFEPPRRANLSRGEI